MEPEERSKGLAEYVERWNGGVFEVMAYSGVMRIKEDWLERNKRPHPELPIYIRVLIIPLPPDFDWSKTSLDISTKNILPNSIIVEESKERWRWRGKKRFRPLSAFLDRPGSTKAMNVEWNGRVGDGVWISLKKFKEITKRNLYIDNNYANQIFSRGEDNRGT